MTYEKPRVLEPTLTKLLPCPFCGGKPMLVEGRYSEDGRGDRPWEVFCRDCGAQIVRMPDWEQYDPYLMPASDCDAAIRKRVVDAWNKRADA